MDASLFKIRFPEFATKTDAVVNLALSDAILSINVNSWGRLAELGSAYLAAHLLTIADRGASGQIGPVVSESVGDLSRTYATNSSGFTSFYSSTTYGQEFIRLRQSLSLSPLVL